MGLEDTALKMLSSHKTTNKELRAWIATMVSDLDFKTDLHWQIDPDSQPRDRRVDVALYKLATALIGYRIEDRMVDVRLGNAVAQFHEDVLSDQYKRNATRGRIARWYMKRR